METKAFYNDTIRRRDGFKKLFHFVRLSNTQYEAKIYLEGTFNLEEALNRREISFWLSENSDKHPASLELFDMMRLSVRRAHKNPRCVVTVMVLGKVENLARMSREYLVDFVNDQPAIVVFENVELFLRRLKIKMKNKLALVGAATIPKQILFQDEIVKEDGTSFPVDWPVEKRLWELRIRENYLETYALNNYNSEEDIPKEPEPNPLENVEYQGLMPPLPDVEIEGYPSVSERKMKRILQEEWTEAYGYSRWVPIKDLLFIHEAQLSGTLSTITSPSQLRCPVPQVESIYRQRVPKMEAIEDVPKENIPSNGEPNCSWCLSAVDGCCSLHSSSNLESVKNCPWCPLAVGGRCFQHSFSN